jgi:aldehyde:ferredoxin oxidoreductase
MEDIEFLLDAYYKARGWDENGIPTRETLEMVGLKDVADSMAL